MITRDIASTWEGLLPYVPRLVVDWLRESPDARTRELDGTFAFCDISGFTKLAERLSKKGKVGAEILTDTLASVFAELLEISYENGGGLIKFGGDALLLFFSGPGHELRACEAAGGIRRRLRTVGRIETEGGIVGLRISIGIHSGLFHFFLVGDSHRELVLCGPAATECVRMEAAATAGQIMVSEATAAALPRSATEPSPPGRLLRRVPDAGEAPARFEAGVPDIDIAACLPTAVRRHLLDGGHEPEHRRATVGFLHFGRADELLAKEGVPALESALDTLISDCQAAADAHDIAFLATDIAADGGKVIFSAGVPRAMGDDEERLLLALRRIIDVQRPLAVRIGVARGHVFAGDVGPHYRRVYTVMGDTVNLAARLMAAAEPGQLLTTERVLDASRTRFRAKRLEPIHLKGKAKPIQPCTLGDPVGAVKATTEAGLPLFGREEEIAQLQGMLDSARHGEGRLLEIVGEPGIGKSRLVEEVRARAGGMTVFHESGDLYRANTPYHPFRSLVLEILGTRSRDETGLAPLLRDKVERAAPQLVPWLPLLGALLDLELPPTPETGALDESRRAARLAAVTGEFLAAVLTEPAVLIFEDAHWMDEASAELLRAITVEGAPGPWLVLLTRRVTDRGFAPPKEGAWTGMHLGPLPPDQAAALVETAFDDDPLAPHEVVALAERSGGNPFFLRELMAAARAGAGIESLPDSAEALVIARIDRLDATDRTILRHASVIGASFDERLLDAVLPEETERPDEAVWTRLGEFLDRQGGGWRFRQALIREAAYEGLPFGTRRALHSRIGDFICTVDETPEEEAEILAMHFFKAQRYEETWRFARVAGERARRKYANLEAAEFYRQALEATRRVGDIAPEEVLLVSESMGEALQIAGEYRKAADAYRAARRLVSDRTAEARLLLKEARIAERVGRFSDAVRLIRRGQRALEGDDHPASAERAQLTVGYAAIRHAQGRHREAIRWCEMAIAEAERAGDREALAHAYSLLDLARASLGIAGGHEYSWKALSIYEEIGDLGGQAIVLTNLGAYAYYDGRWNDAVELYERARKAEERRGDAVNAGLGTFNVAEILCDQGRLTEAERLLRQSLRVWRAAGLRYGIAKALSQLGVVMARLGRFDDALISLREAGAEFLHTGSKEGVVEVNTRVTETLLRSGDAAGSHTMALETLALTEEMGGFHLAAPTIHRLRGYALLDLGQAEEAREALEESLRLARGQGMPYEEGLTLRALVQLARTQGRDTAALEGASAEILEGLGVVAVTDPVPPRPRGVATTTGSDGQPFEVRPPVRSDFDSGSPDPAG